MVVELGAQEERKVDLGYSLLFLPALTWDPMCCHYCRNTGDTFQHGHVELEGLVGGCDVFRDTELSFRREFWLGTQIQTLSAHAQSRKHGSALAG